MAMKEISLIFIVIISTACFRKVVGATFDENYRITYGGDHAVVQGNDVQLSLDKSSGAGFESKVEYASGFFKMNIKLPNNSDSSEVVTAFYLDGLTDDQPNDNPHDELDFEFLGGDKQPYTLQTNMFVNDGGHREQAIQLWFDPTVELHTYSILWNQHQIVFFVDDTPIRVFKNNTNIGVNFPSQGLRIKASIWDGSPWAGDGKPLNWSQAPFVANYQSVDIAGCEFQNTGSQSACYDPNLWWNGDKYATLDPTQQEALDDVRAKYLIFDYCNTPVGETHPECKA